MVQVFSRALGQFGIQQYDIIERVGIYRLCVSYDI